MDKYHANRLLKFGISILQGKSVIEPNKGRIGDCLFLMFWMRSEGMWWQAERLQNWIHRFQGGEFDGLFDMPPRMEQNNLTWRKAFMGTD